MLPSTLADVDFAVINGNYAIEGGLSVKDALAVESDQGVAAKTYANIVVVRKEDENNEALKKLVTSRPPTRSASLKSPTPLAIRSPSPTVRSPPWQLSSPT